MILILTASFDPHADIVERHLMETGTLFLRMDPAHFPKSLRISYQPTSDPSCIMRNDGEMVDVRMIRSIWNRRPGKPVADNRLHSDVAAYIVSESEAFIGSLKEVTNAFWLNDPDANQRANRKTYQLCVASRLGFVVPRTIVTNDPDETLSFATSVDGDFAVKAVLTPGITFREDDNPRSLMFYTKRVDRKALIRFADRIAVCPLIVQEYIPKSYELRVTVVGERIFACAIHSQEMAETKEDWRHYGSIRARHESIELPRVIQQRCHQLLVQLGISFGCIDMIVTPDGQYVFLEINPNGQWLWVQDETGMAISRAIAQMLIRGRL